MKAREKESAEFSVQHSRGETRVVLERNHRLLDLVHSTHSALKIQAINSDYISGRSSPTTFSAVPPSQCTEELTMPNPQVKGQG